jgi:hypothetical protein
MQVEPLEGRALLSTVIASTPTSAVTASTASAPAQLVVNASSMYVNQQQGSFTVTVSLTKPATVVAGAQPPAPLDQPLTVDFSASLDQPGSGTTEAASPIFAPFHESVTFPAGASTETVTVPIISSAPAAGPVTIYLSASSSSGVPDANGIVELYSSPDATPPTITSVQLVAQGRRAPAVVLGFSKPMAPATVEDIRNYRILSRPKMIHRTGFLFGLFGGSSQSKVIHSFPIAAATYDPSSSTVTLTLKRPANASSLYEITSAYPLDGHVLADPEGRPLDQSPDVPEPLEGEFAILVHGISGVTPQFVGPLKVATARSSLARQLSDRVIGALIPFH